MEHYGTPDEVMSVSHDLPGGGFVSLGKAGRAWVEASMPKRADPLERSNVEALPVAAMLEVAYEAYREAWSVCTPTRDGEVFELSNVVRVDPVRDFDGAHHGPELLDGLAGVPRDARWKVRRWQDAERNRAESIRVGPKAWGSTLYDKNAETFGAAPEGRLRYEGRFHREQLESAFAEKEGVTMRNVADVTDEKVARLTRASFERVGFDREVVGRASVASAVFGCPWLSAQEMAQAWAFLTAPGYASSMSKPTRLKYRQVAARLGVTMAEAVEEAAPVFVRLDFESGREVLRAG